MIIVIAIAILCGVIIVCVIGLYIPWWVLTRSTRAGIWAVKRATEEEEELIQAQREIQKKIGDEHYKAEIKRIFKRG